MRGKDNYTMMKRVTPKRVTLHDGRTFVGRSKRVPRSRLPPHKNKKKVQRCTSRQRGREIVSVIKRLLPFGKKAAKKSSLAAPQKTWLKTLPIRL